MINQYIAELKKINLLDRTDEENLWYSYKEKGDLDARRKLIEHYQPLVFKIAMKWQLDDIIMEVIQEGTVGLIEAVERYDCTRGVAFSLFAAHRIRGRILNYLECEGKKDLAYIDSPIDYQSDNTLKDCLVDNALAVSCQAEKNHLIEQVRNALERLPAREQAVLSGVFLEDIEPKKLAERMDISVSHIYRLQKQGIKRIRGMLSKFMQYW